MEATMNSFFPFIYEIEKNNKQPEYLYLELDIIQPPIEKELEEQKEIDSNIIVIRL
jgi:hypothetical protein